MSEALHSGDSNFLIDLGTSAPQRVLEKHRLAHATSCSPLIMLQGQRRGGRLPRASCPQLVASLTLYPVTYNIAHYRHVMRMYSDSDRICMLASIHLGPLQVDEMLLVGKDVTVPGSLI